MYTYKFAGSGNLAPNFGVSKYIFYFAGHAGWTTTRHGLDGGRNHRTNLRQRQLDFVPRNVISCYRFQNQQRSGASANLRNIRNPTEEWTISFDDLQNGRESCCKQSEFSLCTCWFTPCQNIAQFKVWENEMGWTLQRNHSDSRHARKIGANRWIPESWWVSASDLASLASDKAKQSSSINDSLDDRRSDSLQLAGKCIRQYELANLLKILHIQASHSTTTNRNCTSKTSKTMLQKNSKLEVETSNLSSLFL